MLSVSDAARELGLDPSTVTRRIHRFGVEHSRGPGPNGGYIMIKREHLGLLLTRREQIRRGEVAAS